MKNYTLHNLLWTFHANIISVFQLHPIRRPELFVILLFSLFNCTIEQNKYLSKVEREEKMSFESFILGFKVTNDALIGKFTWDALFQPSNFFGNYKYSIFFFFCCLCSMSFSRFIVICSYKCLL